MPDSCLVGKGCMGFYSEDDGDRMGTTIGIHFLLPD